MLKTEWIAIFICIFAALLHGLSGFGFPMMSTAALSTQYSLSQSVAFVILPCLVLNLFLLNADPQRSIIQSIAYYGRSYYPIISSSILGSFLGVRLLLWLNEGYLKLFMGSILILYVLDQFRRQPWQVKTSTINMIIFGFLAGIVGGATNAMAPFLMIYLLSSQLPKKDIIIVSNLNFMAGKLIQLIMLFPILMNLNTHQHVLILLIAIFALLGVWAGQKLQVHLSQQHFRVLIFVLLFLLGLHALWQSANLLQYTHSLLK
ncbi:sulfite exporter TauE/SafE family protein [Acinetobacter sp. 194]|uniref:sulfite exporter TauE/SafE family protein n=1 Tax=Acinetobacter shaoyimingii TaxID=2715164 RepID=UPI00140A2408|nr:sulfite exporter TauE/SafE family protein [Acinetobacter shaoyimingii]NHB58014.1 sulfite exporter TauE/SafE family protein [Acinetobacter shaoyimingii]